jgi:hypothetical protein
MGTLSLIFNTVFSVLVLPTKDFVVLFSTAKAHEFVEKVKAF